MGVISNQGSRRALQILPFLAILFAGWLGFSLPAAALEVHLGDWETAPEGTTAFIYYSDHARMGKLYKNGQVVDDNAKLSTDVGILRFVRWTTLNGNPFAPNLLIPVGQVRAGGNLSVLGNTSGVGDAIIALPYFPYQNPESREFFCVAVFAFLPTGSYDPNRSLNLGENRRKHDIQIGYQRALGRSFNIELEADAMFHMKNGATDLTQKTLYDSQVFLSYDWAPGTRFGVGLFHTFGGRTSLRGVEQDDRVKTTKVAITGMTMLDSRHQLVVSLGKDVRVENGLKEDVRLRLRLLHIF